MAGEAADFADKPPYEARLLQIPAMGVRALWLKAKSRSHADVMIPLAPTRSELNAGQHYSAAAFVAALKERPGDGCSRGARKGSLAGC